MRASTGKVATAGEVDQFLDAAEVGNYHGVPLPHGRRLPGKDLSQLAEVVFRHGVEGKSVLDVGCHHGFFLYEAVRRGADRVLGLEPTTQTRNTAQSVSALHGNPYEVIDGHTLSLPNEHFDVVLLLSVIHHIRNPVRDIENIALAANELVVLEVPEPADPSLIHRLTAAPESQSRFRKARNTSRRIGLQLSLRHIGRHLPLAMITPHRGMYFGRDAFRSYFTIHNPIFSTVEFVASPLRRDRFIAFCVPANR